MHCNLYTYFSLYFIEKIIFDAEFESIGKKLISWK